jgi:hypothetical protein
LLALDKAVLDKAFKNPKEELHVFAVRSSKLQKMPHYRGV